MKKVDRLGWTAARALMALLDNTVAARKDPTASLPILRKVALQAPTIRSVRGEAADLAPTLLADMPTGV